MQRRPTYYVGSRAIGQRLGVHHGTAIKWATTKGLPLMAVGNSNRGRPTYRISEAILRLWELEQARIAARERSPKPRGPTEEGKAKRKEEQVKPETSRRDIASTASHASRSVPGADPKILTDTTNRCPTCGAFRKPKRSRALTSTSDNIQYVNFAVPW